MLTNRERNIIYMEHSPTPHLIHILYVHMETNAFVFLNLFHIQQRRDGRATEECV